MGKSLKSFLAPVDMRQGKEWKSLLLFTVPIVFSYLLQQVYSISDAAICGQTLSADEVAGVNDVSPLMFVFLQFAFGCTAGFSVITSGRFGNGDEAGVRRSFAAQIILSVIISAVLTAIALATLHPLLLWLNVRPENAGVYNAAYGYCFVIFSGIAAQMFYNFICSLLRSLGDSFTPLVFLFISTLLNIGLDLLFIVVFGWGVVGAAAATVAAQLLSTVACFVYTFVKYKNLRLHKEDFKAVFKEFKPNLVQGIPLGLQFSVLAFGIIVMQSELVRFDLLPDGTMVAGNPAQNGYGAACKLGNLLVCPMNALGTGVVSFTAQNYGAGQYDRIRRGVNQSILMMFITYVIIATIGFLLTINGAYQYIFLSADKITERSIYYGNNYAYVALSSYFLLGLMFVFRSASQGVEKPVYTFLVGFIELAARILICLFLPSAVNGGPVGAEASLGAYISLCIADSAAWLGSAAFFAYPYVKYILKQKYDKK